MPVQGTLYDSRIKLWTDLAKVEPEAILQLQNTANLPFVFKHIAVMPDVHTGIGATVGSVIATRGAICPAAVGVDIGCGMMAVKTSLNHKAVEDEVVRLRQLIERSIPVGFDSNKKLQKTVEDWSGWKDWEKQSRGKGSQFYKDLTEKARTQLGSLGGGNHFIEICLDTDRAVWVMLHSGSRGVGNQLAQRHIETAKGEMKEASISLSDPNLAYFLEGKESFKTYLRDLLWCQSYAYENRIEMMRRILEILSRTFQEGKPLERLVEVNCHHNYVASEKHFGKKVWLTRKGALRAEKGELGIIPGSMGTRSYIVEGLGNPESFHSCSHGAGRLMSRTAAKKKFSVQDLKEQTHGVECRKDGKVIDEIPAAYKPIEEVMKNQSDLVKVRYELKQILCVKG